MLLGLGCHVSSSLAQRSFLFSVTKIPLLLASHSERPSLNHEASQCSKSKSSINRVSYLCTSSSAVLSANATLPIRNVVAISNKSKRKALRGAPETVLKHKLDMCSRHGNLIEALRLYDDARSNKVPLSQYHYNVLLYLCSSVGSSSVDAGLSAGARDVEDLELGMKRGFDIYRKMSIEKIAPNEATFTNLARLASKIEDPVMAFDLVKQMKNSGIPPKLRSYEPALFGFCKKGDADMAYEVDAHMTECGVLPDESWLSALLKLSSDVKKADKVYEILHRLRSTVRQVSELTAKSVEEWFNSDAAADIGKEKWDWGKVREGVEKGGGGWHGQGWLGSGRWTVERTTMNEKGVCCSCGERLVCIDIDPLETENFASILANLACQKEVRNDFKEFQGWLQRHGPFDAIVDGANVGLAQQRHFSFLQLNCVVNKLRQTSPSKRLPLIILHRNRVYGGPASDPSNKKLLESWKKSGALYVTPSGSNDDWYWLYAAVSSKCLLVTNDEMRDHLFQLLGTSFFPRWKEKHQIRLSFSRKGLELHSPPPYSLVTQESETGRWHVPLVVKDDDLESPRQWVCATRATSLPSRSLSSHF